MSSGTEILDFPVVSSLSCYQKNFKKFKKNFLVLKSSLVCVDVCESKNRPG
jgi:hypothetical protein